jgi:DNA-directed RNA polymerase subunit RPC12/RpoP
LEDVWQEQMSLIHCESCGNDIVVPQEALAVRCDYCGSSKVLAQKAAAGIPPDGIIPFAVDKNSAGEAFRKWISRRFWAPRSLKNAFHENKIEAIYLPYWTFDAQTDANYTAQGGKVYYVMEGYGENRRRVRKVNWYPVRGSISRFFDDVLVSAKQVRDKLIARIDNFGTQKLLPFSTAYLSGFKAEKYDTSPEQGFEEAKAKMLSMLRDQARREILRYYDEVRSLNVRASFTQTTYKHILVPFWLSSYWYMDKPYRFVINAQTGKISGEAPVSKVKVTLAVLAGLIILVLAFVLYLNYPAG